MINFEKELENFEPVLEISEVAKAVKENKNKNILDLLEETSNK